MTRLVKHGDGNFHSNPDSSRYDFIDSLQDFVPVADAMQRYIFISVYILIAPVTTVV